jgi:hypothetical protein
MRPCLTRRGVIAVATTALAAGSLLVAGCFGSSSTPPSPPPDDSGQGIDNTVPEDAGGEPGPEATTPATEGGEAGVDATVDAEAAAPDTGAGEAAADSRACVDTQSDPSNCGTCGHVCTAVAPSTVSCNTGRCLIALASPALGINDYVSHVAYDATNVYFATTYNASSAALLSVPIGGGTVTTISPLADDVGGLAVGNGELYWTSHNQSRVVATPIDGGSGSTLAYGPPCTNYPGTWNCPGSIALQNGSVYFAATGPYTATSGFTPGNILTEPVTANAATVLAADNSTSGFQIGRVVATSTGIVWNNPVDSTILQVGIDGGSVTPIVDGGLPQVSNKDIAADATNVYFIGGSGVYQIPRTGGAVVTLASGQTGASYVAIDSTSVYWITASGSDNYVAKVPIGGGTVTTLASGLQNGWDIAVDGTNVYFSQYSLTGQQQVVQMPAN